MSSSPRYHPKATHSMANFMGNTRSQVGLTKEDVGFPRHAYKSPSTKPQNFMFLHNVSQSQMSNITGDSSKLKPLNIETIKKLHISSQEQISEDNTPDGGAPPNTSKKRPNFEILSPSNIEEVKADDLSLEDKKQNLINLQPSQAE